MDTTCILCCSYDRATNAITEEEHQQQEQKDQPITNTTTVATRRLLCATRMTSNVIIAVYYMWSYCTVMSCTVLYCKIAGPASVPKAHTSITPRTYVHENPWSILCLFCLNLTYYMIDDGPQRAEK